MTGGGPGMTSEDWRGLARTSGRPARDQHKLGLEPCRTQSHSDLRHTPPFHPSGTLRHFKITCRTGLLASTHLTCLMSMTYFISNSVQIYMFPRPSTHAVCALADPSKPHVVCAPRR